MSNEIEKTPPKRPYTLRARARRQEQVHRRITKAAVYLHGSVGPARTTVSDIAKHAGVRRATVYNHFPTDLELIDACSSHWFGENPPPNPAAWVEISDPVKRFRTALEEMYEYYDRGQEMLENVLRDSPLVPALEEILRKKWWPLLESMVEILSRGWNSSKTESWDTKENAVDDSEEKDITQHKDQEIGAGLRVVLDFFTWQTLAVSGLSNKKAAHMVTVWMEALVAFHH